MHNTEIKTENVTGEAGVTTMTMTNGDLGISRHSNQGDNSIGGGQPNHQPQNQLNQLRQVQQQQQQQSSHGVSANANVGPGQNVCAGCENRIVDRFLLKALDMYWHEDCLKCGCCDCRLGEVGQTLYTKANLILCRRDYLRLFGTTGYCSACNKPIPAFEMVMRARSNVYHLECFACQQCQHRFCVGDKYYLCENKILCEYDYEERMVFANMAYSPGNLALLRRQVSNVKQSGPIEGQPQSHPNPQHQFQQYQQYNEPQFEFPVTETPGVESFHGASSSSPSATNGVLIKSEPFLAQGANTTISNLSANNNNNSFLKNIPSTSSHMGPEPNNKKTNSNNGNLAKTANPKITKASTAARPRNRNRSRKTPTGNANLNNSNATNNMNPAMQQSAQFQYQPSVLHGDDMSNNSCYGSPDSGIVES